MVGICHRSDAFEDVERVSVNKGHLNYIVKFMCVIQSKVEEFTSLCTGFLELLVNYDQIYSKDCELIRTVLGRFKSGFVRVNQQDIGWGRRGVGVGGRGAVRRHWI